MLELSLPLNRNPKPYILEPKFKPKGPKDL